MFDIVNLWKTQSLWQRDILFFFLNWRKLLIWKCFVWKWMCSFLWLQFWEFQRLMRWLQFFCNWSKFSNLKKKEYKIKMLIGVHKLKCLSTNFYPFCIVRQIRKSPLINQILQSDGNNCRLHDCGWTEQGEHRMYLW